MRKCYLIIKIVNKYKLCCNPIIIHEHVQKLTFLRKPQRVSRAHPRRPADNPGSYHCRVNRPTFQHYPPTTMSTYRKSKRTLYICTCVHKVTLCTYVAVSRVNPDEICLPTTTIFHFRPRNPITDEDIDQKQSRRYAW